MNLRSYHAATTADLPPLVGGIQWILAANGVFKRAANRHLEICIQVTVITPPLEEAGLVSLMPYVVWRGLPVTRLPEGLLAPMLEHARLLGELGRSGVLVPVEAQYFLTWVDGPRPFRVAYPPQRATSASVFYEMPKRGIVLADIHSHHGMGAFFSEADNRDDVGLSVSGVIGRIYDRPQLITRLNVYGHRQLVNPLVVFDGLGPFAGGAAC